jgi:hypothetical protein
MATRFRHIRLSFGSVGLTCWFVSVSCRAWAARTEVIKARAEFTMGSRTRSLFATIVAVVLVGGAGLLPVAANPQRSVVIEYDSFDDAGYDLDAYAARWVNPYGLGEMQVEDTRSFEDGRFFIDAAPFETAYDFSVFDHIKYLALSSTAFSVPEKGSITFSAEIEVETPGTEPDGRIIRGVYGPPGCASDPDCAPYAEPWEAMALEGQQAGATLHMIDFTTGQLFDWFVSGSTAFALVERLPATVTGSQDGGTRDTMYTQIVKEVPLSPGPHTVSIRLFRDRGKAYVDFLLDGRRVARAEKIGVPLDVQRATYTGIYPSLGPGEQLGDRLDSVFMAHGLFSLLDAFPFQHADAPELSVSIPIEERIFGQGARAHFDDFVVVIEDRG